MTEPAGRRGPPAGEPSGAPFGGCYAGQRILVTGHSGMVGGWAVRWLRLLAADVVGYSRGRSAGPVPPPPGVPTEHGDIADPDRLRAVMRDFRPQLVLHLAGETLVARGFATPAETFRANLLGSVNVLDSCLHCPATGAVLLLGSPASHATEDAPVGPYAASKQAVEAIAAGYAHPQTQRPARDRPLAVGVVRPGVMVGGDWAPGRLVPDVARAVAAGRPVTLRSPRAARPWQHVLDGLSGLLAVGWRSLRGDLPRWRYDLGRPDHSPVETTHELVTLLLAGLGVPEWPVEVDGGGADDRLQLGCAAATDELGWWPTWDLPDLTAATAAWYRRAWDAPASLGALTDGQIERFVAQARRQGAPWAG